jgi:peptide deformylase
MSSAGSGHNAEYGTHNELLQEGNPMKLKILQVGEPVLRQPARTLSAEEIQSPPIQQLIELMRETMYDAPGVGLAAPQIGLPLQLAVIEDRLEYHRDIPAEQLAARRRVPIPFHVLINPQLSIAQASEVAFFEGCLSLAGFVALVPRALAVQVHCMNERGEPRVIDAEGWYARILQHEIDHLNGTLYIDRMEARSFTTSMNYTRFWQEKAVEQVHADLGLS